MTFAHLLKQDGYETAYYGKWHLDGDEMPGWVNQARGMGFDDNRYMFNRGHWQEIIDRENDNPSVSFDIGDEKTFTTDWLTDKVIEYMQREHEEPFLCMVIIPDPHLPYTVKSPYDTMYKPEDMPIPDSFYLEDLPDFAAARRDRDFPLDDPEREQRLRELKAQYCGMVKCIDDNIGKMLTFMKQQGILDNTIIIYTSDHGEYIGEHGQMYKNNTYETAHRVPLLVRWPANIRAGTKIDEIVTTVDFQQTLVGLLGINTSGREQGRDASPMLLGKTLPAWKNECFIHSGNAKRSGLFTDQFQLCYQGGEFKDHVLFDRVNDPEQMKNLFNDTQYKDVITEMTERVVQHHKELDTDPAQVPQKISKKL